MILIKLEKELAFQKETLANHVRDMDDYFSYFDDESIFKEMDNRTKRFESKIKSIELDIKKI